MRRTADGAAHRPYQLRTASDGRDNRAAMSPPVSVARAERTWLRGRFGRSGEHRLTLSLGDADGAARHPYQDGLWPSAKYMYGQSSGRDTSFFRTGFSKM